MSKPTVSIRLAQPQDAALIKQMIVDLAGFQNHSEDVRTSAALIQAQMAQQKPPFECLIAEVGGHAAGFALFYAIYSTWEGREGLYLEDLFVSQQHRGLGLGKRLLSALADIARTRGCTRVDWMVQDDNQGAQNFYANFGACSVPGWSRWRLELPASNTQTF